MSRVGFVMGEGVHPVLGFCRETVRIMCWVCVGRLYASCVGFL